MENNIRENTQQVAPNERKQPVFKKPWMQSLIAATVIFGALGLFLFWQAQKNVVFIENAYLEAPIISLSPTLPGVLNALYVKEGDVIQPNAQVALIGSQILSAINGGVVASAPNVLGAYFMPGQTVASIVYNEDMEVVGQVEETKGLSRIVSGLPATFSVDAYPGKTYSGTVDQVSPVSNGNGILFSISDARPVKKFNVKVRFNLADYPELKSGMSAKITVHTNGN